MKKEKKTAEKKPQKARKPSYKELEQRYKESCSDCETLLKKLRACELRSFDIMRLIAQDRFGMAIVHFTQMHEFVKKCMRKPFEAVESKSPID